MQDQPTTPNIQKAVAFFRQAGLSRLVEKLREKYIELGKVGGHIILENSTASERQAVASFLGKPLSNDINLKVRVAELEKAVQHSFACSLPALLNAFFPEQPLVTRQERRATHTAHQEAFQQQLTAIAEQLPAGSRGRDWLLHGQHGLAWLFSRYKNESAHERQLELIRYVAHALDQLPRPGTPERLALFAQRTSGDPHMLDADRAAGRLFLYALTDLSKDAAGSISEGSDTIDGYLGESGDIPKDREQVLRLYTDVGLLVDTISSSVAVFNLAGAVYADGTPDPLVQAAGERVLLLPLRQLLEWQSAMPTQANIYVFENPQVFEEVIAGVFHRNEDGLPERGQAPPLPYTLSHHQSDSIPDRSLPTLVCTSGWPSAAALKLLQMFIDQSPDNRLYYNGDFDLKGLQIAASLIARYVGRCYPWRFDIASYMMAMQAGGVAANAVELAGLSALPEVFRSLVAVMQEKGMWAYQEGIARVLAGDVKG